MKGDRGFHMSQSAATGEAVVAGATLFGEGAKACPLRRGRAFSPSQKSVVTATTTSPGAATWLMWKPRSPCSCSTHRFEEKRRAGRMTASGVTTSFVDERRTRRRGPTATGRVASAFSRARERARARHTCASRAQLSLATRAMVARIVRRQRDRCDGVRLGFAR